MYRSRNVRFYLLQDINITLKSHFLRENVKNLLSYTQQYLIMDVITLRYLLCKPLVYRSKAVLLLWIFYVFVLSCVCYVFVRVCLYVLCGHLLGKGWPLGSRLWCLLWVCHFPIGILGQVWYLIVSIPDLCILTYFYCMVIYHSQTRRHVINIVLHVISLSSVFTNVPISIIFRFDLPFQILRLQMMTTF